MPAAMRRIWAVGVVLVCIGPACGDGAGPRRDGGAGTQPPAPVCNPTAGGPYWIEEGQTVTAQASCATGRTMPPRSFEMKDLPAGAVFDRESGRLTWTTKLDQAAVYLLPISLEGSTETGELKIGVADRFDGPGNAPVTDLTRYTEEFGLPVLHLITRPSIGRIDYTPATVVYRGRRYEGVEAKYRGNSSFGYPKKNYTIKFARDDKFNEPGLAGGFRKKRKLMLITPFDDGSFIRWRLAFELWNRMDRRNIRIQHFAGIVYVNGEYQGLYVFADKIDGFLLEDHGLDQDSDIYMGITHNANFGAFRYNEPMPQDETTLKTSHDEGYEKKEGFPEAGQPGALDEMAKFSEFVANSDEAAFTERAPAVLDLQSYYNWIIHATATQAWDTLGKNALHYRDPLGDQPWRVVLWDFNESFGQRWQTERFARFVDPKDIVYQETGGFGYTNRNYLWRRLWNHPRFGPELRARYGRLLRDEIKVETVLDDVDRFAGEVADAVPRDDRKWRRLHLTYRPFAFRNDFNDFRGEVEYVRRWVEGRWAFLRDRYPSGETGAK